MPTALRVRPSQVTSPLQTHLLVHPGHPKAGGKAARAPHKESEGEGLPLGGWGGECASLLLLSNAPHLQMEKPRPTGILSQAQGQAVNLRKSQDRSWQKVYLNGKGLASQSHEGRKRCFLKTTQGSPQYSSLQTDTPPLGFPRGRTHSEKCLKVYRSTTPWARSKPVTPLYPP